MGVSETAAVKPGAVESRFELVVCPTLARLLGGLVHGLASSWRKGRKTQRMMCAEWWELQKQLDEAEFEYFWVNSAKSPENEVDQNGQTQ
jgi:hypothetical protein